MTIPSPQNVLAWLCGEWQFQREVPGQATMTGRATVCALGPDRAEYHEVASVLMQDGQVFEGEQRYLYEQTPEGLAVYFHPGSRGLTAGAEGLFHRLRFIEDAQGNLRAEAEHLCKADLYASRYVILSTDGNESFTIEHDVRGPWKTYGHYTVYQRSRANNTP